MTQHTDTPPSRILLLASEQDVHAFDLSGTARIAIGRHDSNDLRLRSRTVSNYHAEVLCDGDDPLLRDLGSTNGTYVNEESIERRRLESEDRIRIGNHVLTAHIKPINGQTEGFYWLKRNPDSFGVGACGNIISMRVNPAEALKTLRTGSPFDLSLPDLLKILTTRARSVMLLLKRGSEEGRVFVHKDLIVHAETGRARGEKALCRFFGWQEATYEIKKFETTPTVSRTIALPADTLIMEGMRQIGELAKLITQLPPLEVALRLKEDCPLPVSVHTSAEIEIYQNIIRHQTIAAVLEAMEMTDFRILRLIQALLRKGVFEVAETSDYILDETYTYRPQRPLGST